MNIMDRWRPRLAAGGALTAAAVLVMVAPGQIAQAQTSHLAAHVAVQDQPGATVQYSWPAVAIGGTSTSPDCMVGQTFLNGQPGRRWVTTLCRVPDPTATGYYRYYNYANSAGSASWFVSAKIVGNYTYYADRANVDAGYDVIFAYPGSDLTARQVRVGSGPFQSMADFALDHELGFVITVTRNDAIDRGIAQYVVNKQVYAQAAAHPWVQQAANQQATQVGQASSYNAQFYTTLNKMNDQQISAQQLLDRIQQQERLESRGMSADQASQQAQMDVP